MTLLLYTAHSFHNLQYFYNQKCLLQASVQVSEDDLRSSHKGEDNGNCTVGRGHHSTLEVTGEKQTLSQGYGED